MTGLNLPEPLWDLLRQLYGTGPRAYHNWTHVLDMIRWFHEVARDVGWRQPREVFLALLFHDAVYVAGAADNEERSARQAREAIKRWLPDSGIDVERVANLIQRTAHHGSWRKEEVAPDEALFLDCDMAILGGDSATFDAYEEAIAREYAALDPASFRAGRRQFVECLLASDRIYLSSYFHDRLEAMARQNLIRSLARLA